MKFCDYIGNRLNDLGVSHVFGVPGSYIMPTWQALNHKSEIVLTRHESGAVYMADGWSRFSCKPGVVLTTIGPGVTNAVTGIASAYKDSIPLIIISGQASTDSYGRGVFQECYNIDRGFSLNDLLEPITKATFEINNSENGPYILEQAFKIAMSGRKGPVHINIPFNIQNAELSGEAMHPSNRFEYSNKSMSKCFEVGESFFDMLTQARTPLILAGWGCFLSDCGDDVNILSNLIDAPIISTIKGISSMSQSYENYMGFIGPASNKELIEQINDYKPDVIIVLGSSLSQYYTRFIEEHLRNATLVQVDIDISSLGNRYSADFEINLDISDFLHISNEYLKESSLTNPRSSFFNNYNYQKVMNKNDDYMLMANSLNILNDILPEDAVIIPDAGNHWLNTLSIYKTKSINGLFTNAGLGPMGHAISNVIGMRLATDEKKFICVTGDGSILMSGNEISVSVERRLNIIYIVYNNSSLGRVRTYQQQNCDSKLVGSDIEYIDIDLWAKSLGANAYKVDNLDKFKTAIENALNCNCTSVIEVIVDKDEVPIYLSHD